jgi:GNAT superfamily N-acetyltransferase
MSEPMFVRALPSDLERVLGFIREYYKFDGIPFRSREIKEGLEVLLRDRSIGRVWLIRLGEQEVGYFILTFGYDLEFGGRQATLTDLYIADGYRRLGLGSKTLQFLEENLPGICSRSTGASSRAEKHRGTSVLPQVGFRTSRSCSIQ